LTPSVALYITQSNPNQLQNSLIFYEVKVAKTEYKAQLNFRFGSYKLFCTEAYITYLITKLPSYTWHSRASKKTFEAI
jgi:hypothetical protein